LKRKFGGTLESVLETREKILSEIDLADNFSDHIARLNEQIAMQREVCGGIAGELSQKRAASRDELSSGIVDKLADLGIKSGQFVVNITREEATAKDTHFVVVNGEQLKFNKDGIDQVEFYISTNAGEVPKPLVKVASGGEVSRVMLSLKSVLAGMDKIPVLVFDEVDTGISGRSDKSRDCTQVTFPVSSDNCNHASSADSCFFRYPLFSGEDRERRRHFDAHKQTRRNRKSERDR